MFVFVSVQFNHMFACVKNNAAAPSLLLLQSLQIMLRARITQQGSIDEVHIIHIHTHANACINTHTERECVCVCVTIRERVTDAATVGKRREGGMWVTVQ